MRALVADDNASVRKMLCASFKRRGWSCECVADGEEALAVWKRDDGQFDVVVVDFDMPGCNGAAVAKAVRRDCPETALLIISGSEMEAARLAGELDTVWLPKPFSQAEFWGALESVVATESPSQGRRSVDGGPSPADRS